MSAQFTPAPEILRKYAQVLVNFALNSGRGIKPGQVVRLSVSDSAKPFYIALRNQILISGGIPLSDYFPDGIARDYFELASPAQLEYFPRHYLQGLAKQIDHSIGIISSQNKHELEGVDPQKIMTRQKSLKPFRDWLDTKENRRRFTWTLALYGTPAMAKEAGLSLRAYWDQIIQACFLDSPDPVAQWRRVFKENSRILRRLNSLSITRLHLEGSGINLWIQLGPHRRWVGGSGRNIPSFEVFTSPDWRGTEGTIEFNQPLYHYGHMIEGIRLVFQKGRVVSSAATHNHALLKTLLAVPNADKIGEFSLTDKRLSRINHFMAETLFDENMSGPYGNTHLALGTSYHETYRGHPARVTASQWAQLGFNDSAVHTDIISTTPRTVTAYLSDSTTQVIYQDGLFLL